MKQQLLNHIILLGTAFIWSSYSLVASNQQKKDSLLYIIKTNPDPQKQTKAKFELGMQLVYTAHDTALLLGKQILHQSLDQNDVIYQGKSCLLIGIAFFMFSEFDSCEYYFHRGFGYGRKANDRTLISEAVGNLGIYYQRIGKPEKAFEQYEEALVIQIQNKDTANIFKTYVNLSSVALDVGDLKSAATYCNKALKVGQLIGNEEKMDMVYDLNGVLHHKLGDYEKALIFYQKSLDLRILQGDAVKQADMLNQIGLVHDANLDFERALDYYFRALELYDSLQSAAILSNIAETYSDMAQYEDALRYHELAYELHNATGNLYGLAVEYNNRGLVREKMGNFKQAVEDQSNALAIQVEIQDIQGECFSRIHLGKSFFKLGQQALGIQELLSGIDIAKEQGFLQEQADGYEILANLESERGNHKQALDYLQTHNEIRIQLLNDERSSSLLKLEVRYETEQREKELISEKLKNRENEYQLQQKNYGLLFLGGIIVFGFALGIVLYRNYVRTKRDKAKIETLQKDIHHRVKTSLGTVSSLLTDLKIRVKQEDLTQENILESIKSLEERIARIGELHRHLYKHGDVTQIDFQSYLEEMSQGLNEIYADGKEIQTSIHAPVKLGLDIGIPIVLIISELFTNSFRYAFTASNNGKIALDMVQNNTELSLSFSDNGVGFADKEFPKKVSGLQLIQDLAEQLHAQATFKNRAGVHFSLTMKVIA